jgi:hypothetical protein
MVPAVRPAGDTATPNSHNIHNNIVDGFMTEKDSEKFEKVRSKIEKTISPYIKVKIPMLEGVDKEAFLGLEKDPKFIESLAKKTKKWLTKKQ